MTKKKLYTVPFVLVVILVLGYFIADYMLFDGVKSRTINENGFQANFFAKNSTEKQPAIVLIGGGQWGDYWAQEFSNKGFVGLSLPYIGREGLPKLPEGIDLEYFEKAFSWLLLQPEIDPDKLIVMGASRNAELALLIASIFPKTVNGVIAYAPSSVVWANQVLPYSSEELMASWKYQGKDIPYIPMEKISGNDTNKIQTLDYWMAGLNKSDDVSNASIKVENIAGPILLLSGKDDQVWPSSIMADMIEKRINESNFEHGFQNIKYENAGHLISSHPDINSNTTTGTMKINGKDYEFELGGTFEGNKKAKQDAKDRIMEFIEKL